MPQDNSNSLTNGSQSAHSSDGSSSSSSASSSSPNVSEAPWHNAWQEEGKRLHKNIQNAENLLLREAELTNQLARLYQTPLTSYSDVKDLRALQQAIDNAPNKAVCKEALELVENSYKKIEKNFIRYISDIENHPNRKPLHDAYQRIIDELHEISGDCYSCDGLITLTDRINITHKQSTTMHYLACLEQGVPFTPKNAFYRGFIDPQAKKLASDPENKPSWEKGQNHSELIRLDQEIAEIQKTIRSLKNFSPETRAELRTPADTLAASKSKLSAIKQERYQLLTAQYQLTMPEPEIDTREKRVHFSEKMPDTEAYREKKHQLTQSLMETNEALGVIFSDLNGYDLSQEIWSICEQMLGHKPGEEKYTELKNDLTSEVEKHTSYKTDLAKETVVSGLETTVSLQKDYRNTSRNLTQETYKYEFQKHTQTVYFETIKSENLSDHLIDKNKKKQKQSTSYREGTSTTAIYEMVPLSDKEPDTKQMTFNLALRKDGQKARGQIKASFKPLVSKYEQTTTYELSKKEAPLKSILKEGKKSPYEKRSPAAEHAL